MNRKETIAEFNLPRINQTEYFKEQYRAVRLLVDNLDRAYERLVKDGKYAKANRRTIEKSAGAGIESIAESS